MGEASQHAAEKLLSAEKQAEADAASELEQQEAKAATGQASANDQLAAAQEAHTNTLAVKQKLQVELDASRAQASEAMSQRKLQTWRLPLRQRPPRQPRQ